MKFRTKSQLTSDSEAIHQHIYDDCGPSSIAAAVAWASNYTLNPSASDGVAAKAKATGFVEKEGVADNGSSLSQLIATARVLGAHARLATSWDDVVKSAKAGAGLGIWVQQSRNYPAGVDISLWHRNWTKYWMKHDPSGKTVSDGYGHMTAGGYCDDHGFWWCCPTRSGVGAEEFGVQLHESQLRQIAESKGGRDFEHVLIVTHPAGSRTATPTASVTTPAQGDLPHAAASGTVPTPMGSPAKPVAAPLSVGGGAKNLALGGEFDNQGDPILQEEIDTLKHEDWGKLATEAFGIVVKAASSAAKEKNPMDKIATALRWIADNTGIDEALWSALRAFASTCIAMMLATGAPLLDMTAHDFHVVVSGGLAATLQVVLRALNPDDTAFGLGKSKDTPAQ